PVSTPHGPIPIGKIVGEKLIGLEIYDGTENGAGTTRVVAVKSNGEKPVLRIVLDGGAIVEATGDHLVYVRTSDGMAGRWVRVDSLERGMKLVRAVRDKAAEALDERSLGGVIVRHRTLIEVAVKRLENVGVQSVFD